MDFKFESLVSAENSLKVQLERLKKIKEERLKKYWALKAKDKCISIRLGVKEYLSSEDTVPTAEYLEALTTEINSKESDLERLVKVYLEKRKIILSLMKEMEIKPCTALEKNIASEDIESISLTKEFLNSVQCYHQELLQQCQERKELAIQLRETLSLLWDRLCVSATVREAFHADHPGHGLSTINALRQEIKRCEELKRQNIKQFVEKLRSEIKELWEVCLLGSEEESDFPAINSTDYTEELLEQHELEVLRLKKEADNSKYVMEYLGKWNRLYWKQIDLDDRVDDPDRLFDNRGGQLLKEEKERKAIQKELPKVEEMLMKYYKTWCEIRGRTYTFEGLELSNYIADMWKKYHERKEMEKMERKRAKEKLLDQEAKLGTQVSGSKRKCLLTPGKSPASSKVLRLAPVNDKKTPSKAIQHSSRRLLEKPKDNLGENLAMPLVEDPANHSIASTVATYADFTHHLELLSKDINCRSSTLPEAVINERRATPLRPFNTPKLTVAVSPKKQETGSSRKFPVTKMKTPSREMAKTPTRGINRTPGTPARTPNMLTTRSLRSGSKSRIVTPKFTTPRSKVPFLV